MAGSIYKPVVHCRSYRCCFTLGLAGRRSFMVHSFDDEEDAFRYASYNQAQIL